DLPPIMLGATQSARFQVVVPNSTAPRNSGILSVELANWGPQQYLFTSAAFIGTTWPFGQEFPVGPSPGAGHVDAVNYEFKQQDGQWSVSWNANAGPTKQSCSLNVVPHGGGSFAYIVLRL